jgi:thiol-disulfide isomerase/thioredoxin
VLDFWATTCPPCRYTIPYLSNIQNDFKSRGVVVIGISAETSATVKKLLPTLDSPVEYAMAIDANRQTSEAYLKGVGWEELPHAFVIDKAGRLVWHGNSTVALEKILGEVLDGTLQVDSARRTVIAEKLIGEYFLIVTAGVKSPRTADLGEQILANASGYASILNEFAWRILTDRRVKIRDYDLALRASKEAFELSGGNQVPIMDTYARALFQAGKRTEAIELEKKAIAACKNTRFRPELESVLLRFERLSREKPLKK